MRTLELRDGTRIPSLGLGTWLSEPGEVYKAVREAIQFGYRHIDCAWIYENQGEIGNALNDAFKANDVSREELWVTSKLWNNCHEPNQVVPAIDETLRQLQLDYLDLYLVHWPVAQKHAAIRPQQPTDFFSPAELPLESTWEAMLKLTQSDKSRQVGVSNCGPKKLESIARTFGQAPAVNQVELHPFNSQEELLRVSAEQQCVLTAYAPLGSGGRPPFMSQEDEPVLMHHSSVLEVAEAKSVTPAQVLLTWGLMRGTVVIPKSTNAQRIRDNFEADDMELTDEQMRTIDALNIDRRYVDGAFWCGEGSPYAIDTLWD